MATTKPADAIACPNRCTGPVTCMVLSADPSGSGQADLVDFREHDAAGPLCVWVTWHVWLYDEHAHRRAIGSNDILVTLLDEHGSGMAVLVRLCA